MTSPEQPPITSFDSFQTVLLDSLGEGDFALHGQLYPGVYPGDQALPEAYTPYTDFVRRATDKGAALARLRTLPDPDAAGSLDSIAALAQMSKLTDEAGETIRVCRFSDQLGQLALRSEVTPDLKSQLTAEVPRGGFWSIRRSGDRHAHRTPVIGLMDYADNGTLPGVRIHFQPPPAVRAYEQFWYDVFKDEQSSVPLSQWPRLFQ